MTKFTAYEKYAEKRREELRRTEGLTLHTMASCNVVACKKSVTMVERGRAWCDDHRPDRGFRVAPQTESVGAA